MGIEEPLKRTWQEQLEDKQYGDQKISPKKAAREAAEAIKKTVEKKEEKGQQDLFLHHPDSSSD